MEIKFKQASGCRKFWISGSFCFCNFLCVMSVWYVRLWHSSSVGWMQLIKVPHSEGGLILKTEKGHFSSTWARQLILIKIDWDRHRHWMFTVMGRLGISHLCLCLVVKCLSWRTGPLEYSHDLYYGFFGKPWIVSCPPVFAARCHSEHKLYCCIFVNSPLGYFAWGCHFSSTLEFFFWHYNSDVLIIEHCLW